MHFRTKPFATLNTRIAEKQAKLAIIKAEENLKKKSVNPQRLMYNYDTYGIMDTKTGEYYTGKFVIPADKFERIVKVINGQEVSNLIRFKTGEKFSLEITGHNPKIFKTNLSNEEYCTEIEKLHNADQQIYNLMMDNFEKRTTEI